MSTATMELTEKVMALPTDERVILVQHVWDSIEHFIIDPEIEKSWMDESEKRWQEIEQGRVQCVSAKEVMKKARVSLNK